MQSVLAPWYAVDGHVGVPLHWYASEGGVDYWEIGGMAEFEWCCKVMVEASKPRRLHSTIILCIYIKCFSTLIYCGWTCGWTLILIHQWRWWWIFGKLGAWLSPSDVVKSWLRLQSPIDCIPHPSYVYAKCFSTLICCGWTCGCTPTLICLWRWWWIFGKLGVWLSLSDV